ncbi:hypothetical protein PFISCL1PPCAC_21220, partial [Pristionchus fissidentatus]
VYRNLVTVCGEEGRERDPPLIVAVKTDGKEGRSSELLLLDSATSEQLFTVNIESSNETNTVGGRGTVWVHRSPGGGGDAVGLLTLRTARAGRKKANIDAIACFEGTLKRTEEQQLVRTPELTHHVAAIYATSAVDSSTGKLASCLVALSSGGKDVSAWQITARGALRHIARSDLVDTEYAYYSHCSNLVSTPDASFFLINVSDGEVMLVEQRHSDAPLLSSSVILQAEGVQEEDELDMDELAIFSEAAVDIRETGKMLFAMRRDFTMQLYTVSLADQSATLIAEQEIDREMAGEEDYLHYCKLIAVGSLQGAHEVWLFDNDKVWRWRGRKGVCDEEATLASTGFGYTSTAVAVSLKSEEEKEECEEQHDDNGDSTRVDFVCVGTREGRIGCWCTIEAGKEKLRETRRFDLNGIGAASRINELSIEVCDPLVRVDDDLAFG